MENSSRKSLILFVLVVWMSIVGSLREEGGGGGYYFLGEFVSGGFYSLGVCLVVFVDFVSLGKVGLWE